jgi:hypothetical protein
MTTPNFKDVIGNQINIGDVVATNHKHYRFSLFLCTVTGFTAQRIKLSPIPGQFGSGNMDTLRYSSQCIVTRKDKND